MKKVESVGLKSEYVIAYILAEIKRLYTWDQEEAGEGSAFNDVITLHQHSRIQTIRYINP